VAKYEPKPYKDHPGWYEIPGFSKYAANRKGFILNKRLENETQGGVSGRYRKVSVYADGESKPKLRYTHDLICRAFHGKPKKGQVVIHKDNDRLNIKSSNLKWGTQSQNIQDMWDDGLREGKESAPLTRAEVEEELEAMGLGFKDIANWFNGTFSQESLSELIEVPTKHTVKSRQVGELFHLSFSGTKAGSWSPITPAGTEDVNPDDLEFGEPPVPRISLSPTLEQCFRAVYPNIDFYFKDKRYPHVDIYAYRPRFKGGERIVLPETLTQERWVWDAHVTGEHWVLDKVEMELVGRYRFFNTEDNTHGYATRPFDDPNEPPNSYVGPNKVEFIPLKDSPALENLPPSAVW